VQHAAAADWAAHWSTEHQESAIQRFFSFYRKAVFARAVGWYVDRYLPATGVFVEAGSGTSETSMLIDKRGNARILVAVDIVLPILAHCHPTMDVRIGGDIFRLPFRDESVDGVWNVGVMEHFSPAEIDRLLCEFRRVIRPGGRLLLLWPGVDSAPQKVLDLLETLINARRRERRFRFHPPEISRLPSLDHGRQLLRRNGFNVVRADVGIRNLLAFNVLVGARADSHRCTAEAHGIVES
jgi:SAM-dependent methyltransferase